MTTLKSNCLFVFQFVCVCQVWPWLVPCGWIFFSWAVKNDGLILSTANEFYLFYFYFPSTYQHIYELTAAFPVSADKLRTFFLGGEGGGGAGFLFDHKSHVHLQCNFQLFGTPQVSCTPWYTSSVIFNCLAHHKSHVHLQCNFSLVWHSKIWVMAGNENW